MMGRRITFAPCIPFHTSCTFTSHHVGPCTANTGIFNRLVCIHCHFVTGSCLYHFLIMINPILSMMRKSIRESTRITGFQDMNTMFCVPLHGMIHLTFIVGNIASSLMMSDDFNAFLFRIMHNLVNVKISIRFRKVKILHTTPAFPSFVPSLKQNTLYIIGGSEINILLGIGGSGSMTFVHLPSLHTQMHSPPHSDIFQGTNPIGSFQYTRFVQIQNQGRINQPDSFRSNLDGTPGSSKMIAFTHFDTIRPRS